MDAKYLILALFLVIFSPVLVSSQNNSANHSVTCEIPELALLSLVSENEAGMNISAISPSEAGNSIEGLNIEHHKVWVNYSSIMKGGVNHTRKIEATIEGEVPENIQIFVKASQPSGAGKGKLGVSSGLIALSNQPAEIINNIGSCYTGKGINNGHYLTYEVKFDKSSEKYAQIARSATSINVLYTLTDTY